MQQAFFTLLDVVNPTAKPTKHICVQCDKPLKEPEAYWLPRLGFTTSICYKCLNANTGEPQ